MLTIIKMKHHNHQIYLPANSNNSETDTYQTELYAVPKSKENAGQHLLHSIRNPLTNIEMCVSMLKATSNALDVEMYLNMISHSAKVVLNIANNQLMESDNTVHSLSLNKVADDALDMAMDRIILRHIEVQKSYAENVGECLLIEPEIKTALLNIIINAIEAMPAKNGILKMTTRANKHTCDIIIKDNGTGISEENMAKLFRPYYTSKSTGLGLGLATSLKVFRSHKASVKVDSMVDKGSSFTISFNKIKM
jgi:signal transduction histidine kinase